MQEIPGRIRFKDLWVQRVKLLFAITAASLFFFYIWPSFWAFDHHEGKLIRYYRLEPDAIQVLTDHGWAYVRENRTPNQILNEFKIDTTDSARLPRQRPAP